MKRIFLLIVFSVTSVAHCESANQLVVPSLALKTQLPFLTIEETKYIQDLGFITVCNTQQAERENASLNIVKLIVEKTNITLKGTKILSWNEGIQGLKDGTCDILPWATETTQRKKVMSFTRPYARLKRVIITQNHQPYIADLSLVSDQIFVMIKNNSIIEKISTKHPKMNFLMVETYQEALEAVVKGKAFAMIISIYSATNIFDLEEQNTLKIAGILPDYYDDTHSLATLKGKKLLHNILQKSVLTTNPVKIKEFMNQDAIYRVEPEINYQRYWLFGLITALTIVILIFWNRRLKAFNTQLEKSQQSLKEKTKELEVLSVTDPLTKIYNRLKIDEVFYQEIKRNERYQYGLSIFMIDIDYFKSVNDEHGHLAGDKVLTKISSILKNNLRNNDFLGRWGGEEFLVICPSTNLKEAEKVAEKLRKTIEKTDFPPVKKVTASFGVAQWVEKDTKEILISKADYAMYLSKQKGRNKVSISKNEPSN